MCALALVRDPVDACNVAFRYRFLPIRAVFATCREISSVEVVENIMIKVQCGFRGAVADSFAHILVRRCGGGVGTDRGRQLLLQRSESVALREKLQDVLDTFLSSKHYNFDRNCLLCVTRPINR